MAVGFLFESLFAKDERKSDFGYDEKCMITEE